LTIVEFARTEPSKNIIRDPIIRVSETVQVLVLVSDNLQVRRV